MPIYHSSGLIPPKRHIALRKPDGGVYYEHLMGHEGFSGTSCLMYHTHPPTAIRSVTRIKEMGLEPDPDQTLKHRHFLTSQIKPGGSPTMDRTPLLYNSEIAMLFVAPTEEDEHFYRNAQADEVVYVAKGSGVLETQFGDLPFGDGDYLVIHRGLMHRYRFDKDGDAPQLMIMESRGHIRWPKRYRNQFGQLIEGAPYSERDIRLPGELKTHDEIGDFSIYVKQYDGINEMIIAHHPFDVIGWDGYFYPWAFNIRDFEPIVGKIHQPPPIHQTFEGDGFVICSFCPRPFDFHPEAIPAPYAHSNVDSDEVLFYVSDEFMSRKGIEFGSMTHHPDGMPHGPHPGTYEGSIGKKGTDEMAVMMDSFRPLTVAKQAKSVEDEGYYRSWIPGYHDDKT